MTECLVAEVTLYGWRLLDPGLVVCSLIALTLGVVCGLALLSSPSPIASLPFFGFAVMMSEAAVTHVIESNFATSTQMLLELVDVGLTSSIAVAFFFVGAVDAHLLRRSRASALVVVLTFAAVWGGWIYAFFFATAATQSALFDVLYVDVILAGCGFFAIVQAWLILCGRFVGAENLALACMTGVVGLKSMFWCGWPIDNVYLSPQFWWFILSDVSMFFVYRYFARRMPAVIEQ